MRVRGSLHQQLLYPILSAAQVGTDHVAPAFEVERDVACNAKLPAPGVGRQQPSYWMMLTESVTSPEKP